MTRVVTESGGRVVVKISPLLFRVPVFTGGVGAGPVWCSCHTAADIGELLTAPTETFWVVPVVLTMTISSGAAEANASTPGLVEAAETIVVPNLGNKPWPVNIPIASYNGIGVS